MYFEFSKSYSVILSSNDVSAIKEEKEEGRQGWSLTMYALIMLKYTGIYRHTSFHLIFDVFKLTAEFKTTRTKGELKELLGNKPKVDLEE